LIGLLQRVTSASVEIADRRIAEINRGLLVLTAVESGDGEEEARWLADRLCRYRVFPDSDGKMNLNVREISGKILLVPQFTLAAATDRGLRPSFHTAADPQTGQHLFQVLTDCISANEVDVQTGEFGADMQVSLVNDGPVTFWLQNKPTAAQSDQTMSR
jgi:D-tyrosyl-tRNA(Tyr) deacylase